MATAIEQRSPPLVAGDSLTREEFMRRWERHPEIKNAELIGGVVYMASPVSPEHGQADSDLGIWIGTYRIATPGTESGHNTTVILLGDTAQPDNHLRIAQACGGGSWPEGTHLSGVPELVCEICRSSAAYDLHAKLELYEAAGVPEYLAVLQFEEEIRWHVLLNGKYELLPPDGEGLWRSRIFPGLWLDGKAMLARDLSRVLSRLHEGLESAEHQAFVAELQRRTKA